MFINDIPKSYTLGVPGWYIEQREAKTGYMSEAMKDFELPELYLLSLFPHILKPSPYIYSSDISYKNEHEVELIDFKYNPTHHLKEYSFRTRNNRCQYKKMINSYNKEQLTHLLLWHTDHPTIGKVPLQEKEIITFTLHYQASVKEIANKTSKEAHKPNTTAYFYY